MDRKLISRLLAEMVGTWGIVFAPVALSATSGMPGGASGLMAAASLSGFVVLAMISAFGPISAAHFNPAVTLGFASAGRFPWRQVPGYLGAQFLGAILAAGLSAALYGPGAGTHVPATPDLLRAVGTEVAITAMLMLVIMGVATDSRTPASLPPLAIGLAVGVGVMIGGPVTGGSMNPARSLGPALFAGGPALSWAWLYLVAPPLGAVLGARLFELVRLEPEHAKSAPKE